MTEPAVTEPAVTGRDQAGRDRAGRLRLETTARVDMAAADAVCDSDHKMVFGP